MDHKRIIEYLLLAAITGSAAMITTDISEMSKNLQQITASVQELNARIQVLTTQMVQTRDIIQDHEARIRHVEKVK